MHKQWNDLSLWENKAEYGQWNRSGPMENKAEFMGSSIDPGLQET